MGGDFVTTSNNGIPSVQTDVVVSFQQSLANLKEFNEALGGLDARFGGIEQKITALKTSIAGMSEMAATAMKRPAGSPNTFAQSLEQQKFLLDKSGKPMTIQRGTVNKIMQTVENQVNAFVSEMGKNIRLNLDPNVYVSGKVPVTKDDFEEINKEIAKIIKTQVSNMANALRKFGGNLITAQDLQSAQLKLESGTVQTIMSKIKEQLVKKLINPKLETTGVKLSLTSRDLQQMVNKIKSSLKDALNVNLQGVSVGNLSDIEQKVQGVTRQIDNVFNTYMANISREIGTGGALKAEIPVASMEKRLQNALATQLGVTVDQLQQQLSTISLGDAAALRVKEDFNKLGQSINKKINSGLGQEIKEMIAAVDAVQVSYAPRLQSYMTNQINRVNNAIVKKIREQIDLQFQSMLNEVDSVYVAPKQIKRTTSLNKLAPAQRTASSSSDTARESMATLDPYARRDAYFNSHGLGGAFENTLRHIFVGSTVGLPIAAVMEALSAFKSNQSELTQLYNHMLIKSDDGKGNFNSAIAQQQANGLFSYARNVASTYGIDYEGSVKATTIAARRLHPQDVPTFMNNLGQISTFDNSTNPEELAKAMEGVLSQFQIHAQQLQDQLSKPLFVATSTTAATVKDIMDALVREGSSLKQRGTSLNNAVLLTAAEVNNSGNTGANIGNFNKTLANRLYAQDAIEALKPYGVKPFDTVTNPDGTTYTKPVPFDQLMTQLADGLQGKGGQTITDLVKRLAGIYQAGRFSASIPAFGSGQNLLDFTGASSQEDAVNQVAGMFANLRDQQEKLKKLNDQEYEAAVAKGAMNPAKNMERAKDNVTFALEDMIRSLSPSLNKLTDEIVNLSQFISKNSDAIAGLIGELGRVAIGFAIMQGARYLGRRGGYQEAYQLSSDRRSFKGNIGNAGLNTSISELMLYGGKHEKGFMNALLRNEATGGQVRSFAGMDADKIKQFTDYVKNQNMQISSLSELFLAMNNFNEHLAAIPMATSEKASRLQTNMASVLNDPKLANAFDPNFITKMNKADATKLLGANLPQGHAQAMDRLSQLTPDQVGRLGEHLSNLQQPITSFKQLAQEVNNFYEAERKANLEAQKAAPAYTQMEEQINKVEAAFNGAGRSVETFRDKLGKIPNVMAGIMGSAKNLTAEIGGMVKQMLIMDAIGRIASNLAESMTLTDTQKKTAADEKERNQTQWNLGYDTAGYSPSGIMKQVWGALNMTWDSLTGGDHSWGAMNKQDDRIRSYMIQTMMDKGMSKYDAQSKAAQYMDTAEVGGIDSFLKDYKGGMSKDKFANDLLEYNDKINNTGGPLSNRLKDDYTKKFQEYLDKGKDSLTALQMAQDDAKQTAQQAGVDVSQITDLPDTAQEDQRLQINSDIAKYANMKKELDLILQGYKENSQEYIDAKRKESDDLAAVYDASIKQWKGILDQAQKVIDDWKAKNPDASMLDAPTEVKLAQGQVTAATQRLNELQSKQGELSNAGKQQQYDSLMKNVDDKIAMGQAIAQGNMTDLQKNMDTTSVPYANARIAEQQKLIDTISKQLDDAKAIDPANDLTGQNAKKVQDLENQLKGAQLDLKTMQSDRYNIAAQEANRPTQLTDFQGQIQLAQKYLDGFAKDTAEYISMQRTVLRANIDALKQEAATLEAQTGLTPEDEKKRQLEVAQKNAQIAGMEEQYKETYLQQIEGTFGRYQRDFGLMTGNQDIGYLQSRVKTGLDESSPYLTQMRIRNAREQVSSIAAEIQKLRVEQSAFPDTNSEEYKKYQQEITDLTKQSLNAQLGILDELKKQTGTFNLPDGVKAMTYYQYLNRNGSQSTYTVQRGDVNITMSFPNVSDKTTSSELQRIGENIGTGLNRGWSGAPLPNMVNANVQSSYRGVGKL